MYKLVVFWRRVVEPHPRRMRHLDEQHNDHQHNLQRKRMTTDRRGYKKKSGSET